LFCEREDFAINFIKAENLDAAGSQIERIKIDGNVLSPKQAELPDTGKSHQIRFIFK
jgi:hypothetical protein